MSGRYSRNKGKRIEYEVRDLFRAEGFTADRVPSSGAAQGFKGDIRVISSSGQTYLVEVKGRKCEFKSIYELRDKLDTYPPVSRGIAILGGESPLLITLVRSISELFKIGNEHYLLVSDKGYNLTKHIQKCMSLHKYVKECDILVVKDDRRPPLFLRYE